MIMEFFEQSQKEQAAGLPSQPFMQKPPDDMAAKAKLQVNFIDFVVAPIWEVMADFFPGLQSRVACMKSNRLVARRRVGVWGGVWGAGSRTGGVPGRYDVRC